MPFPRTLAWSEMQIALSKIWTQVTDSISYDNIYSYTYICLKKKYIIVDRDLDIYIYIYVEKGKMEERCMLVYLLIFFYFIVPMCFNFKVFDWMQNILLKLF